MDGERAPTPPENPLLRYLATLRAARDFGVSRADLERVVRGSNPLTTPPEELAAALADVLLRDGHSL
jgi:Trp operon repressor